MKRLLLVSLVLLAACVARRDDSATVDTVRADSVRDTVKVPDSTVIAPK